MPETSLTDIARRLDDVSKQLLEIVRQMREDRQADAVIYARQDTTGLRFGNVERRVDKVEEDAEEKEKADASFRRQLIVVVVAFALPLLATIVLAVNNFLAARGT